MTGKRTILCPVDFSEGSDRALSYALELAQELGYSLELIHAYEMPIYAVPAGLAVSAGQPGAPFDFGAAVRKELSERMDAVKKQVDGKEVEVRTHLVEGAPATAIVEHAKATDAALIVIGTHGRTGLSHLLIGSVAERVVRLAQCPVLTVRL